MNKRSAREKACEIRKSLSSERRLSAGQKLFEILCPRLNGPTLSFASFADEIDLWPVNAWLEQKNWLLLPGIDLTQIRAHAIRDSAAELKPCKYGYLAPQEEFCPIIHLHEIACVLVPGLAFDQEGRRIGYGSGYYDRLLSHLNPHAKKIGIGFREQLSATALPQEDHDIILDELILV